MGLDMYAFKIHPGHLANANQQTDLDFSNDPEGSSVKIAYWRKFHQLHGWMERLYRQKGGGGDFNCNSVRLMPADLLQLALDAEAGLADTAGFFFGTGEWDDEHKNKVLDFCMSANQAITDGYIVFYDSWW